MIKHLFIQKGFTKELTTEQGHKSFVKLFDLSKWFKEMAARMGIQTFDNCCPGVTPTGFPTRLKADKSGMEYLDIDGVWKVVP